jgi:hypothetical protein
MVIYAFPSKAFSFHFQTNNGNNFSKWLFVKPESAKKAKKTGHQVGVPTREEG